MIEKSIELNIPPGVVKNGTLFEQAGRWNDSHLIRFLPDGGVAPVGGRTAITLSAVPPAGQPQHAEAFRMGTTFGSIYLIVGLESLGACYVVQLDPLNVSHTVTDITIGGGFPSGGGSIIETWWDFSRFSTTHLLAVAKGTVGGSLYSWDLNIANNLAVVAGAPTNCSTVVLTPENFVMVGLHNRRMQWASQGTLTTWTPASTNSAGSIDVPSKGGIVNAQVVRGRTLVWTGAELFALNYVGAPLYYGIELVGDNCGLRGPYAVTVANDIAYWIGSEGAFYKYDGYVQRLRCDVADWVQENISTDQTALFCYPIPQYSEVWWVNSITQKYVVYNYALDCWYVGNFTRTAGCYVPTSPTLQGADGNPFLWNAAGTEIARAEDGSAIASADTPYLESGPLQLGDGDQLVRVQKVIPDVAGGSNSKVQLFAGTFPQAAETTGLALTTITPGTPINTRFTARYVRVRYEPHDTTVGGRVGKFRLGVIPSSRR